MPKSLLIAICFLAVVAGAFLFTQKSRTADHTGKPGKALLEKEIQPFSKAMGGEPFHYFDRSVISGLQSQEIAIGSGNLPEMLDQAAKGAKWIFHSSHAGPYSRSYRYCKGRLSLNAEVVSDGNGYWQYGIYWESDSAGSSYCGNAQR